jgi:hypothetical protein
VHGVHHALQGRIEERLAGFGIEVPDQRGIPCEVGKQHGDLFALTLHGVSAGEDFLRQIRRRVGQRGLGLPQRGSGGGVCHRGRVARPDQAAPRVIDHVGLRIEEFVLQGGEVVLVKLELELKSPIRHAPTALEHGNYLVEDLLKGHRPPSRGRCGGLQTVWEYARPLGRRYTAHRGGKKAGSMRSV